MRNNFEKFKKGPLFIAIIFFALSCFLFVFLYEKIQINNKTSEQAEAEWLMETSKKEEVKSLDRLLKITEGERALLDTHFVQSSDIVPLLDTVERLALSVKAKAEVTLVNMLPDNTSLTIEMKATGTFGNLYKFLILLENSPYQLEFTSMNMQKMGDGAGPDADPQAGEWSATFNIKLLSFIK